MDDTERAVREVRSERQRERYRADADYRRRCQEASLRYYRAHRETLTAARKRRYRADPEFAEIERARARDRYARKKAERRAKPDSE